MLSLIKIFNGVFFCPSSKDYYFIAFFGDAAINDEILPVIVSGTILLH
ncbi:MAG: hypothetical protein CM1200mP11_4140 [Nitrosopumilaceae archaeon]|nr:MAG: hypothetical protein CM1200mP11_4140 [Nitrosopumilaceae archaeon]